MRIEYSDDISKEDKKALKQELRYLRKNSETFRQVWKDLKKSKHIHTIHSIDSDRMAVDAKDGKFLSTGNSSDIYLNPNRKDEDLPLVSSIAHEFGHSWRIDQGLEPELEPGNTSNAGFIYSLKHGQYREFEGTHFENVIRSELGMKLRETYGQKVDNHVGNVIISGIMNGMLDLSKQRFITIGRDKSYNYQATSGHYQRLKQRTRGRGSFNLNKYTDVNEYN